MTIIEDLRKEYHQGICQNILFSDSSGIPNNSDKHSKLSVSLAKGIAKRLAYPLSSEKPSGQTSGRFFETINEMFIKKSLDHLQHLRPGNWIFNISKHIEEFEQYDHLHHLSETLHTNKLLRATLGDYLISPDIVIGRKPVTDKEINRQEPLIEGCTLAQYTPLRLTNSEKPILHASVSCKWTIRSDRAQNVRTEGLNLIRNRKGNAPHIVIITAEPYPQRIASLALGTGDIDCVYHFALPELRDAAEEDGNSAVLDMLDILISGKRLRDISDLPFDLAI